MTNNYHYNGEYYVHHRFDRSSEYSGAYNKICKLCFNRLPHSENVHAIETGEPLTAESNAEQMELF
jgi:hypothetical protein